MSKQQVGLRQSMLSCVRKVRHFTLAGAEKARVYMQERYPSGDYHTYYCALCKGYHVGNAAATRRKGGHA